VFRTFGMPSLSAVFCTFWHVILCFCCFVPQVCHFLSALIYYACRLSFSLCLLFRSFCISFFMCCFVPSTCPLSFCCVLFLLHVIL
jgi:hypothetical protein